GWWGSVSHGPQVSTEVSLPRAPLRAACVSLPNRSAEELNTGVPVSLASRKISITSLSEPAMGLSINSGLRAFKTGLACSRCGRPSRLSSSTASTSRHSRSMLSYIRTPYLSRNVLVYPSTLDQLDG